MYSVTVNDHFSSAHFLRNYSGKCENLHGHNYRVELTISSETLDETGMVCDFNVLKTSLKRVLDKLDHKCLNELPQFSETNPTAEQLAAHIYEEMRIALAGSTQILSLVRVWETDRQFAEYRPD